MPGIFNARNALAAIAAVTTVGSSLELACRGVAACQAVPGRMQPIEAESGRVVLVDYAHTLTRSVVLLRLAENLPTIVAVGWWRYWGVWW